MKKDGDLHIPSPANPIHINEALLATAGCFPLNFLQALDLPDPDTEDVHDFPSSHHFRATLVCPVLKIKEKNTLCRGLPLLNQ